MTRGERGATSVEYGLIAAACVLVLVFGVDALKLALGLFFSGMQDDADGWVP